MPAGNDPAGVECAPDLERFLSESDVLSVQLKLTDDGQALYEAVAPVLDDLADRVEQLSGNSRVMRLRLGVLPLFGSQRQIGRAHV